MEQYKKDLLRTMAVTSIFVIPLIILGVNYISDKLNEKMSEDYVNRQKEGIVRVLDNPDKVKSMLRRSREDYIWIYNERISTIDSLVNHSGESPDSLLKLYKKIWPKNENDDDWINQYGNVRDTRLKNE